MSEWKKVKLGDICERVTSGGTPKANVSSYYFPPIIPWLKTKEVNYCRITETENFISEEGLNNSSAKLIAPNSVIIAMYGQGDTAGRVAINKIPLTTNQACCNLTIDESKADYEFIYYQLCTLYNKMVSLKAGAAQPNLNAQIIKNLEVLLPSLPMQHHIATALSRYDSLIENYQKQIKLLEEAAQRLYKEWFVDLRFPGHENTKIVDGVPEGWVKKKIGDIVIYYDKQRKPLSSMQRMNMEKIYPYYGAASLMDYVDDYLFDGVYLLFGEDGTVITPDNYPVLQYVWGKFWVNNHAHVLRGNGDISTEFIYSMFKEMSIADVVTGAAQPKISHGRLSEKKVIMPSMELVMIWSNATKSYFDSIKKMTDEIRLLTEARDRLLPKLMSGSNKVKSKQ